MTLKRYLRITSLTASFTITWDPRAYSLIKYDDKWSIPLKRPYDYLYAAMSFPSTSSTPQRNWKRYTASSHIPLPANYLACLSGLARKRCMRKHSNELTTLSHDVNLVIVSTTHLYVSESQSDTNTSGSTPECTWTSCTWTTSPYNT